MRKRRVLTAILSAKNLGTCTHCRAERQADVSNGAIRLAQRHSPNNSPDRTPKRVVFRFPSLTLRRRSLRTLACREPFKMRQQLSLVLCALFVTACESNERSFVSELDCEQATSGKEKPDGKYYSSDDEAVLKSLEYPSEVVGWNEKGRHVEKITQLPHVALKVPEGWLVGASRGEWGGEAVFIRTGSPPQTVINDNVEDIYEMPFGYVVTAGLAHLSLNRGAIYVVNISEAGHPKAEVLFALAGQPETSWKLSDGRLLVNMSDSSVLLDQHGYLHRVRCNDMKYRPMKDPVAGDF